MTMITLQEAQAKLPELIHKLTPGDQVVITENSQPVAQLTRAASEKPTPIPGRCQGMLTILAEDDEHLRDFAEYMP
jgi:antitoxin (DNA-binding transcriptional repressor) of toxin-antitoxin stability system